MNDKRFREFMRSVYEGAKLIQLPRDPGKQSRDIMRAIIQQASDNADRTVQARKGKRGPRKAIPLDTKRSMK